MKHQLTQTALFCSSRRFAGFSVMGGIGFFAAMKELERYPGYAVDEEGNVYSLERKVPHPRTQVRTIPFRKMKLGPNRDTGYFKVSLSLEGRVITKLVHRLVAAAFLGLTDAHQVDHKDGNRANNRLENLRLATHSQNRRNSKGNVRSQSGMKGVYRNGKRWVARIYVTGKSKHLGMFGTPEEAHAAYCAAAKELYGEFFRA